MVLTVSLTFTSIPAAACLWLVGEALTVPIRHMKPTQRFSAFHLTQITNKFHEFSVVSSDAILSFFFLLLCSCSSYYLFWIVKYLHELLYNFIVLFPTSQTLLHTQGYSESTYMNTFFLLDQQLSVTYKYYGFKHSALKK